MQTSKATFWRHLLGRLPKYRVVRQGTAKRVTALLRPELLNDHLRRDLGLPVGHGEMRLPRL